MGSPLVTGRLPRRIALPLAVIAPAAATAIGLVIGESRTTAASLVYLLAIVAVAIVGGRTAGIVSAVVSSIGLMYFFTIPRRTFSVTKNDELIALVTFVIVAMVVASLATVGRTYRASARSVEREAEFLYTLALALAASDDPHAMAAETAAGLRAVLGLAGVAIEVPGETVAAVEGRRDGTPVEIPLATADAGVGTMWLYPSAGSTFERRVAVTAAQHLAGAIARARLAREARAARLDAEAGRLREALLSAVSHDFRTPLASIKASLTALLPGAGGSLDDRGAAELLRTAVEETDRLERLVANLLDIARLRAGTIQPARAPVRAEDLVEDTLASLRPVLAGRSIDVAIRPQTPALHADPDLVGQVLRNLIQNAARYAPETTPIQIQIAPFQGWIELRVIDHGPGIPPSERDAVFDEFYRGADRRGDGSGIGLAFARAIVLAHGGRIWIDGTPGGGTTVAVRLPSVEGAAA